MGQKFFLCIFNFFCFVLNKEISEAATPAGQTGKKNFRRSSINIARRPVDIRSGASGGKPLVANKDVMVSRRKSNLSLEQSVECL